MAEPNAFLMKVHMGVGLGADPEQNLFASRVANGVVVALNAWKATARFEDIKINAVTAMGKPGCLKGAGLSASIKAGIAPRDDWERKMAAAVAAGVDANWKTFTDSFSVPGLPWYPAFAAMPCPVAPPTPNVPCLLLSLPHRADSLRGDSVASAISAKAGDLVGAKALADLIGGGFAVMALSWVAMLMIKNVMGTGPVPSFAPPFVPVGPVVNGSTLALPGCFG